MNGPLGAIGISIRQNRGLYGALALFSLIYLVYHILHPRGFSSNVLVANANETVSLAFVAMAQAIPVLVGGLDLSVGAVMTLTACIASGLLNGSPLQIVFGMIVTVAAGTAFGLVNGLVIVLGRLQPIIVTLATGAIAMGLALIIRPTPGGNVDGDLNWALTNSLREFGDVYGFADGGRADWFQPIAWIPVPLIILFGITLAVWLPFRRTVAGRTLYHQFSSAAYYPPALARAKIAAFTLQDSLPVRGALPRASDLDGQCRHSQAGAYTLNSIASVVLGGISLLGGIGSALGALIGAMILRVMSFYFRILAIDPLLQPLIEGVVLLLAVSIGAVRALRVKNRLDLFR